MQPVEGMESASPSEGDADMSRVQISAVNASLCFSIELHLSGLFPYHRSVKIVVATEKLDNLVPAQISIELS